jgi:hypothetical protein
MPSISTGKWNNKSGYTWNIFLSEYMSVVTRSRSIPHDKALTFLQDLASVSTRAFPLSLLNIQSNNANDGTVVNIGNLIPFLTMILPPITLLTTTSLLIPLLIAMSSFYYRFF